mmetsp:Transcript_755/g.3096  ORF Transcript_755/g.3096 Transcript_755/m.3096 type:complete len:426 (+) Transcript_755:2574-3851(+)
MIHSGPLMPRSTARWRQLRCSLKVIHDALDPSHVLMILRILTFQQLPLGDEHVGVGDELLHRDHPPIRDGWRLLRLLPAEERHAASAEVVRGDDVVQLRWRPTSLAGRGLLRGRRRRFGTFLDGVKSARLLRRKCLAGRDLAEDIFERRREELGQLQRQADVSFGSHQLKEGQQHLRMWRVVLPAVVQGSPEQLEHVCTQRQLAVAPAQRRQLQPRVEILLRGDHERAQRQQALPDCNILRDPAEPNVPLLPQRPQLPIDFVEDGFLLAVPVLVVHALRQELDLVYHVGRPRHLVQADCAVVARRIQRDLHRRLHEASVLQQRLRVGSGGLADLYQLSLQANDFLKLRELLGSDQTPVCPCVALSQQGSASRGHASSGRRHSVEGLVESVPVQSEHGLVDPWRSLQLASDDVPLLQEHLHAVPLL